MLTLVHAPRSRSSRFLFEEIGEPYEIQYVSIRRSDGSGALDPANPHPHGKVPVLKDGASMVFEQTAIALYLVDKFPDASRARNWRFRARGVSEHARLLFRCARAGIYIEIHEGRCAARDSRLGRFRRGDDFRQWAHRCTTLYRGRDVHRGGCTLCRRFRSLYGRSLASREEDQGARGLRRALRLATGARTGRGERSESGLTRVGKRRAAHPFTGELLKRSNGSN